jgi:MFS superfamily sulfate permease-like transporter
MSSVKLFANLRHDIPAAIVVFLVALPLCLGIAVASDAPAFTGLVAGIVGGILVGALSGSQLGVSGPAAGLVVIVATAIRELGGIELMLTALILAGGMQILMGFAKAGVLAYYFPSSVIKGMLTGIGVIIVLKQIPHAVGYNRDFEGDLAFVQQDSQTTLSELVNMLDYLHLGSILIVAVSMAILILWERPIVRRSRLNVVPGPLLAVVVGILMGKGFQQLGSLALERSFFVDLPVFTIGSVLEVLPSPDFGGFLRFDVWKVAFTLAIVASVETLLCVEATDRLDPLKRVTPTNRELFAQGIGNSVSGLLGGLPVTQVIVRSSANIQSGGRSKLSAILHGLLLLLAVLLLPGLLRTIPLASLAAILILVGWKLAKPELFVKMFKAGTYQFLPFVVTVVGVVFTDLLTGVMIGLGVGVFQILYNNYRVPFHFDASKYVPGQPIRIKLSEDVSFLNKASIQRTLNSLPAGAHVIVDASETMALDPDVAEILQDQLTRAPHQGIKLELVGMGDGKSTAQGDLGMVLRRKPEPVRTDG